MAKIDVRDAWDQHIHGKCAPRATPFVTNAQKRDIGPKRVEAKHINTAVKRLMKSPAKRLTKVHPKKMHTLWVKS